MQECADSAEIVSYGGLLGSWPLKMALQGFDLSTICDALGSIKTKWFEIGVRLGIPRSKLLEFKGDPDPLSAVVDYWLRENVPESSPRTWKSIVRALKSDYVGEPGLAEKISKVYDCQRENTDSKEDTIHSSSTSNQPSPAGQIDPDVRMDLEFILKRNLRQIMNKYATYVDCLCVAVRDKGVTPEDLRLHLLSLPASSNSCKGQTLNLLSDKKEDLEKCSTIASIFTFLSTECASFLNYDIFQSILDRYQVADDPRISSYSEHLKAYVNKHKISEFVKVNPLLKHKKSSKELTLKYDIPTTSRLAKVCELKEFIAEIMDITPSALEIVDINDGCVIITFLIPSSIANYLFTQELELTPQQEKELQSRSVLWIECNGYTFNFDALVLHPDISHCSEQLDFYCKTCEKKNCIECIGENGKHKHKCKEQSQTISPHELMDKQLTNIKKALIVIHSITLKEEEVAEAAKLRKELEEKEKEIISLKSEIEKNKEIIARQENFMELSSCAQDRQLQQLLTQIDERDITILHLQAGNENDVLSRAVVVSIKALSMNLRNKKSMNTREMEELKLQVEDIVDKMLGLDSLDNEDILDCL